MGKRKPRHRFSFVAVFWWLMLLLTLGVSLLLFGEKESRESQRESRALQGFPALSVSGVLSGQFMTEFENYLSDAMFGRDRIVDFSTDLLGRFSALTAREQILLDVSDRIDEEMDEELPPADPPGEGEPAAPEDTSAPEAGEPLAPPAAEGYEPRESYSLSYRRVDGGLDVGWSYSPEDIVRFMAGLSGLRAVLPEDGRVNAALVHNAHTAYTWLYDPDTYCGWVSDAEEYLQALAPEGVRVFNTAEIFEPHLAAGEYLYFRTDNHWTPRGAAILCAAMMEEQGYPPVGYEDYAYKTLPEFLGVLYSQNPSAALRALADELDIPYPLTPARSFAVSAEGETEEPFMDDTVTRYVDLAGGSPHPWRRIVTGLHTGRRALVISDSFGPVFSFYLAAYYDEVHVADLRPRYFQAQAAGGSPADLIARYEIDDVYVILSKSSGLGKAYAGDILAHYFGIREEAP